MPGAGVGREDGRATALEVLLPLRRGGRLWLVVWLGLLRSVGPLRRWAFRELDDLRFVYAIRWALLPPFVAPRPGGLPRARVRRPEERWHLLFQSNFDGDWDEYLENFGAVMPRGLASLLWAGVGYPGLSSPALFKQYAKAHDRLPEHYASAYVELTAADIRRELVARDGRGAVHAIERSGYRGRGPHWTNLVLPLADGRVSAAVRAARALEPPPTAPPGSVPLLLAPGSVHFARAVVVQHRDRAWLVVTLTHDGAADDVLRQVVALDRSGSASPPGTFRRLLEAVEGLPAATDAVADEHLVDLLLAHRPASRRHELAYCAYPGSTVADVHALGEAGRRHERFPDEEEVA